MRYSEQPSIYRDSKRALEEFLEQNRKHERGLLGTRRGQRAFYRWSRPDTMWTENRCRLCRIVQKSSKSFSADDRGICLSCSMRGMRPRWLSIADGIVALWRGPLHQRQFAAMARMHRPQIARYESNLVDKVNGRTARSLATAIVLSTNQGNDLRAVMETWPLFPLLADPNVIDAFVRGTERRELIVDAIGEIPLDPQYDQEPDDLG